CRLADDAVDEGDGDRLAVARLSRRLARVYAGRPADNPADRAFAEVVAEHRIPEAIPAALIEGLAWDAEGRRFRTLSDLHAYAARVAGTVGVMMTLLMGERRPAVLARACDLGVAMQLSNIARDVGEDARNGRVYLPLDWLAEAGVDPARLLARPEHSPALGHVVAQLLAAAEGHYARALAGIGGLPMDCRPAIMAARLLYREIGREVARADFDAVSRRAVVSKRRKLGLLLRAMMAAPLIGGAERRAAMPETQFLIDALPPEPGLGAPGRIGAKIDRALTILAEMPLREGPLRP
ncbi:MAG: phytoene/squalene synthase family protein, partial [Pseudomonadota bacterium]